MTTMDKVILISIDVTFAFLGLSNLIAFGADHRHIFAGFAGSLLVTTTMKNKNWGEKTWYALGGFSFVSFVAPAVCTYANIDHVSTYGVAAHFILGVIGMAIANLLLDILDQTKINIPAFIATLFRFLTIKFKTVLNIHDNNKDSQNSGSAGTSDDSSPSSS